MVHVHVCVIYANIGTRRFWNDAPGLCCAADATCKRLYVYSAHKNPEVSLHGYVCIIDTCIRTYARMQAQATKVQIDRGETGNKK
jgi:hypothetical protein